MPSKHFALDEHTTIVIYKRRTSRHLRLSVSPDGEIRVSIPAWAPYKAGVDFARARSSWIKAQQRPPRRLQSGQAIGKAHHLLLVASPTAGKVSTRVRSSEVVITYPIGLSANSTVVQSAAEAAAIRALRQQAEQLLPQRLAELARRHDFSYRSVGIKRLKSRWGSCDQHGNIVLNLFLMQLPWDSIDYVLLHELTHTRLLRHGPDFWRAMETVLPDVRQRRRALREHQPLLAAWQPACGHSAKQ